MTFLTSSLDIEALRFSDGDTPTIRMVAFGGGLPAGYRNGGLYREGQLSSVPHMIAHQMGLKNFISPLFERDKGNGSGYLIYDKAAALPSWKQVANSSGVVSKKPYVLSPYLGSKVDNITWPEGPGSASEEANFVYPYPKRGNYLTYLHRFFNYRNNWYRPFNHFVDSIPQKTHLVLRKMVLLNHPNILDSPFFHIYDVKKLIVKGNTTGVILDDSTPLIPTRYLNPKGYLFLDQKRKLGLVKRIQKQSDKFGLTNPELNFPNS